MAKVAIVTGGAAGLGRLITLELVRRSLHVVVADRDAAAGTRIAVEAGSDSVTSVVADASDADDIGRVVGLAGSLGDLTVLINNAGGWLPGRQFPESEAWRRAIDLNLAMPMLATQLCLPLMASSGGGAVVNVSSSGGWDSTAYGSPEYGAAKAGLIRFTTAVQDFQPRFGVRVSCVVPHWIGLDRAVAEYETLSPAERQRSGGLVDPAKVVGAVAELITDPDSAGRVVVVRPDRDPYRVDPASYDPVVVTPM